MNPPVQHTTGWPTRSHRQPASLAAALLALVSTALHAQAGANDINATRPTVANAATLQPKGVLQVETGYDAYPQNPPGNQQTVDTGIDYAPFDRLRLDFLWTAFTHQQDGTQSATGVSTIQIGGKVQLKKEQYHRWAPAIGLQYEAELPTAPQPALNGYGQQAIVLLNHHYGPNGDFDLILNGSLVQSNCQTSTHCSYGGQQSAALSYHLNPDTRLYAEAFAQNVSQSNTPPGTYIFGGFLHQCSNWFGIDGGLRFGLSDHSASIGTTVGLVFARRLRPDTLPDTLPHSALKDAQGNLW